MKPIWISSMLLVATSTALAFSPDGPSHEEVAPVTDAMVPEQTKSNEPTYVIVSGILRNGCVTYDRAFTTTMDERTLEIRVLATVTEGPCTMARKPYRREVTLGTLPAGEHKLVFVSGDGSRFERVLTVD